MPEILSLLNTNSLLPHGFCLNWTPALLWLYVIADALIFLFYFTIPLILAYFVWRKKDMQFSWVYMIFAAFWTSPVMLDI
jgi:ABC-type polysaccharide/polyol phosphate export permease